MAAFTPERLVDISRGHGLGGGGYAFENVPTGHPLASSTMVMWDDPDLDYLTGGSKEDFDVFFMTLFYGDHEDRFPPVAVWDDHVLTRTEVGVLHTTERDCDCHGSPVSGEWEYSGDASDDPKPDCMVCEGGGYKVAEGGAYALYRRDYLEHGMPYGMAECDRVEWATATARALLALEAEDLEPLASELFSLVMGLYWYAAHHYNGMVDPLYAVVCELGEYIGNAGACEPGVEADIDDVYEWLGGVILTDPSVKHAGDL